MPTLAELLSATHETPATKRAEALAKNDYLLIRELIQVRRDAKLTQTDIADRLGVTQPTVAAFERMDSDPKLSTIRRYAQAVGALVAHVVEADQGQLFEDHGFTAARVRKVFVPVQASRTLDSFQVEAPVNARRVDFDKAA